VDGTDPAFAPSPAGETVAEAVRRRLLDAILFGDLAGPRRLFPAELARSLNVSITPVRQALARLAADGFIEAIPRHGYHVRSPTPGYVTELWGVRLALELMAGESILRRLPDERERQAALAPLRAVHARLAAQAARSHRHHVALNGEFHDTLVDLAGNGVLRATYHGIRVRLLVAWVQRGSRAWRARLANEQAEHGAVLDALHAADGPALDAALRRHLSRSLADAHFDLENNKQQGETDEDDMGRRGGGRAGGAVGGLAGPGPKRAANHHPDVDLPEPGRHQPAGGRAR